MVNQNTFNKIIMREITTFPKNDFFLFLIDQAPHIVILCALEFYIVPNWPKNFRFQK